MFQTPVRTGEVRHANVPWMIHISGSGADEHIELSMWLRALTAQAQDKAKEKGCSSQVWGRMGGMDIQFRQRGKWVWLVEKCLNGLGGI